MISCFLAVLLLSVLPGRTVAAETTNCTVSVDSVRSCAGEQIMVPVRITGNPGFTNAAIRMDYDREKLTLESLQTVDGDTIYLCGAQSSVNPAWTDQEGKTYGYVNGASAGPIGEDGILFTATFLLKDTAKGSATVTPVVDYMRSNAENPAEFKDITTTTEAGAVIVMQRGDINGDGKVTLQDVTLAYKAYKAKEPLSENEMAADFNRNGSIEESEMKEVFRLYQEAK